MSQSPKSTVATRSPTPRLDQPGHVAQRVAEVAVGIGGAVRRRRTPASCSAAAVPSAPSVSRAGVGHLGAGAAVHRLAARRSSGPAPRRRPAPESANSSSDPISSSGAAPSSARWLASTPTPTVANARARALGRADPVEPAGADAGPGSGPLHLLHRPEVRAGRVRLADRVHGAELTGVPERLERRERRVQARTSRPAAAARTSGCRCRAGHAAYAGSAAGTTADSPSNPPRRLSTTSTSPAVRRSGEGAAGSTRCRAARPPTTPSAAAAAGGAEQPPTAQPGRLRRSRSRTSLIGPPPRGCRAAARTRRAAASPWPRRRLDSGALGGGRGRRRSRCAPPAVGRGSAERRRPRRRPARRSVRRVRGPQPVAELGAPEAVGPPAGGEAEVGVPAGQRAAGALPRRRRRRGSRPAGASPAAAGRARRTASRAGARSSVPDAGGRMPRARTVDDHVLERPLHLVAGRRLELRATGTARAAPAGSRCRASGRPSPARFTSAAGGSSLTNRTASLRAIRCGGRRVAGEVAEVARRAAFSPYGVRLAWVKPSTFTGAGGVLGRVVEVGHRPCRRSTARSAAGPPTAPSPRCSRRRRRRCAARAARGA